jgi:predicted GNAT family N-acyltransferase
MDNVSSTVGPIVYRRANIGEIIQLRHDVLIIGTNRTSPDFDGDLDPTTFHFGAFSQNTNLCCLSMMRSDVIHQPACQLRGMATHQDCQKKGIGQKLLQFAEDSVQNETGIGYFWCNARLGIENFYIKQGWTVTSEPFMIEGVCMHLRLEKQFHS